VLADCSLAATQAAEEKRVSGWCPLALGTCTRPDLRTSTNAWRIISARRGSRITRRCPGWPAGDGPEHHHYSATAPEPEPEDDGVVPRPVLRDGFPRCIKLFEPAACILCSLQADHDCASNTRSKVRRVRRIKYETTAGAINSAHNVKTIIPSGRKIPTKHNRANRARTNFVPFLTKPSMSFACPRRERRITTLGSAPLTQTSHACIGQSVCGASPPKSLLCTRTTAP
jgi:hypothetical protein